jgi:hypothetical protein
MNRLFISILVMSALGLSAPRAAALSVSNQVVHSADLNFALHGVTLSDVDRATLNAFGVTVAKKCYALEEIVIHAGSVDPVTPTNAAARLQQARLEYIKDHLVKIHGIDPTQIYTERVKRGGVSQITQRQQTKVKIVGIGKKGC